MTRFALIVLAGFWAMLFGIAAAPARAQTVTRDAGTGDYRVSYVGHDGVDYTVVVEASDKVDPELQVEVRVDGDLFFYDYTLAQRASPAARQPIFSVDVDCPLDDPQLLLGQPDGWGALQQGHLAGMPGCSFLAVVAPLEPGSSVTGFLIRSSWLPAVVEARVRGFAPPPVLASGESTPEEVESLIFRLSTGADGGNWRSVYTISPVRSPASMQDPVSSVGVLVNDVRTACGDLAWITNQGICDGLEARLGSAGQSLAAGRMDAARGSLRGLLDDLEAERGDEPGKHVDDNAYWLLRVNVENLLSRLPPPGPGPSPPR